MLQYTIKYNFSVLFAKLTFHVPRPKMGISWPFASFTAGMFAGDIFSALSLSLMNSHKAPVLVKWGRLSCWQALNKACAGLVFSLPSLLEITILITSWRRRVVCSQHRRTPWFINFVFAELSIFHCAHTSSQNYFTKFTIFV